jgi:large subunit ribosomal protein L9
VEKQNAQEIADAINGKKVVVKAKAGAGDKLFGAVTASNVADAIEEQLGKKIEKKKISLKSEIKSFGTFEADIRLYTGINASVTVDVTEA